jgi:hypothetical protein
LELAFAALIGLVGIAIPTATLGVSILIYRKLDAIERALNRRE